MIATTHAKQATRVQPSQAEAIAKRCLARAAELNDGSLRARFDIANVRAAEELTMLAKWIRAEFGVKDE